MHNGTTAGAQGVSHGDHPPPGLAHRLAAAADQATRRLQRESESATGTSTRSASIEADEQLLRAIYDELDAAVLLPANLEALRERLSVRLQIDCGICGGKCVGHAIGVAEHAASIDRTQPAPSLEPAMRLGPGGDYERTWP